jgi:sulfur-oxidizing protein SoxY
MNREANMNDESRRDILKQGGLLAALLGCGLLSSGQARAAIDAKTFQLKTMEETLVALGGKPVESKDIELTTPDIAENGAVVPVAVTSRIPNTEEIYILVEKNPSPLTATFALQEGTEPFVSTRTKMGQTSNIYAIVKADGKFYSAAKETRVTLGGCGG